MDAVMTGVADAHRSGDAKRLLQFEAPPLILRRVHVLSRVMNAGGKESRRIQTRNRGLNLSKSLAGSKTIEKSRIRSGCIFKETGGLIGCEVVSDDCERVQERGVSGKIKHVQD